MNGKTAKLLRRAAATRIPVGSRFDGTDGTTSVDIARTAQGRRELSHRERGSHTRALQRRAAGRA